MHTLKRKKWTDDAQMLTNQHQVMQQQKLNHLNILKSLKRCLVKKEELVVKFRNKQLNW